ncbi:MAG: protease HtpX [Gammaproteobacteria bacterium]|nr:MAG: protease HtpX [Gammaproteobacteria bacterium]
MRRIFYFLATNVAVLLVLSVVMKLFGLDYYLSSKGINYTSLLIFSAIFGMGGAFISLLMSKWSAKRMAGVRVIEQPTNDTEQWLMETVRRQAEAAGIGMPEVGVFDAPVVNAFATGASKNNALVAVSSGLLRAMNRDEAEAVIGHEITHVANGDMVTLTLIQGVVNTFVIFFAKIAAFFIDSMLSRGENDHRPGIGYFVADLLFQMLFGVLASMVVAWFSRQREFRADAGGARLAGKQKMINALERLKLAADQPPLPDEMAAFGITGGKIAKLFSSHPPLDVRIEALQRSV